MSENPFRNYVDHEMDKMQWFTMDPDDAPDQPIEEILGGRLMTSQLQKKKEEIQRFTVRHFPSAIMNSLMDPDLTGGKNVPRTAVQRVVAIHGLRIVEEWTEYQDLKQAVQYNQGVKNSSLRSLQRKPKPFMILSKHLAGQYVNWSLDGDAYGLLEEMSDTTEVQMTSLLTHAIIVSFASSTSVPKGILKSCEIEKDRLRDHLRAVGDIEGNLEAYNAYFTSN